MDIILEEHNCPCILLITVQSLMKLGLNPLTAFYADILKGCVGLPGVVINTTTDPCIYRSHKSINQSRPLWDQDLVLPQMWLYKYLLCRLRLVNNGEVWFCKFLIRQMDMGDWCDQTGHQNKDGVYKD